MKNLRKLLGILIFITIIFCLQVSNCQGDENQSIDGWNTYWSYNKEHPVQMSLCPGEDESIINFSWYSKDTDKPSKLRIYDTDNIVRDIYVKSINIGNGYVSNKCKVDNLEKENIYYYSYTVNGEYTKKIEFRTQDENFSFILMGDPQIGASYKYKDMSSYEEAIKEDSYNWNKALESALNKRKNASFIVSIGDETNTKNDYRDSENEKINKMEFCGFLCPNYLRNIPLVNVIGNHDKHNSDFNYHFNNPNQSNMGKTPAGSNYYFTYNNTLILVLNTNNTDINEHKRFIEDVVKKNENIKWKVAVFHHDIYGCGIHSNDEDVSFLRKNLPSILEENEVDIVFNGHDHLYSRTYPLYNNKSDSKGIVYITLNSSTGSKFYKNTDKSNIFTEFKFDEKVPTYSVVDVYENSMKINTYRVDSNEQIDKTIEIYK